MNNDERMSRREFLRVFHIFSQVVCRTEFASETKINKYRKDQSSAETATLIEEILGKANFARRYCVDATLTERSRARYIVTVFCETIADGTCPDGASAPRCVAGDFKLALWCVAERSNTWVTRGSLRTYVPNLLSLTWLNLKEIVEKSTVLRFGGLLIGLRWAFDLILVYVHALHFFGSAYGMATWGGKLRVKVT